MSSRGARLTTLRTTYADAQVVISDEPTTAVPTTAKWAGVIGIEGELTGDGRAIERGALRWEDLTAEPMNIRYVRADVGAHDGAEVVGNILSVTRRDGGLLWAEGDFDLGSEAGREAYRMVAEKRQNGVSMDLDDVSFEVRVAAELVDEMDNLLLADDTGEPARVTNPDGTVTVATIKSDDEVMYTTSARVRAATIVAVPAFSRARINVTETSGAGEPIEPAEDDATPPGSDELAAMVAAAPPLYPPAAWFEDPRLDGPTPLTITADGRVFGHLALWGACHVSHTTGGKCVSPPNSPSGYSWFHTGALMTDDGDLIGVGHLTMGTGHAEDTLTPAATLSHYDNTGTVAADVRAGEDAYGVWVSGGLRGHVVGETLRAFRSAPLSGDWRWVNGGLELVAALSVNVPGFGVPRPHGRISEDTLTSLVASGIIVPVTDTLADTLSAADVKYLRSFVERSRRVELNALVARRQRIKIDAFAATRRG